MNGDDARAAIEPTLRAMEEAWRGGDGASWAKKCTPDVDFINLLGMYVKGRAAVVALHDKIFVGPYAGSTLRFSVEHVRALGDEAIVAIVPGELDIPQGPVKGIVRTIATILFVREEGEWHVAGFQNTKREATAADHTSVMAALFET